MSRTDAGNESRSAKVTYTMGIDIGSTTVKIAIMDSDMELIFSDYKSYRNKVRTKWKTPPWATYCIS